MKAIKRVPKPRVDITTTYTHILTLHVDPGVSATNQAYILQYFQEILDNVIIGETFDYSTVNIQWRLADPANLTRYHADCRMFGDFAVLYHTERVFDEWTPRMKHLGEISFEITKPLSFHTVLAPMELSDLDSRERSGTGSSYTHTETDTESESEKENEYDTDGDPSCNEADQEDNGDDTEDTEKAVVAPKKSLRGK